MSTCECGACHRTFGTLDLFDTHQHWDRTAEWALTCVLPPGLVQDRHGTWHTPEGLASRVQAAARFAAARSGAVAVSRFPAQNAPGPTPGVSPKETDGR